MNDETTNLNYLSPTGYKVTIDSTQFANTSYFCVACTLPPITAPEASLPFRGHENAEPSDTLSFGTLDIRFIVDQEMTNYIELYNWITNNAWTDQRLLCDVTLTILDSRNNLDRQIRFLDAFPVALGGMDFSTQTQEVEHVTVNASFRYTQFEFVE